MLNEEQLCAAKRINDTVIDFLDLFYHCDRLAPAIGEQQLEGSSPENDFEAWLTESLLTSLWSIENTLTKEFFWLGDTAVYDFLSGYYLEVLFPSFNEWLNTGDVLGDYTDKVNEYYEELDEAIDAD